MDQISDHANPDDVTRLHLRRRAAGGCDRRGFGDASVAGNGGVLRMLGVTGFGLLLTPASYTIVRKIGRKGAKAKPQGHAQTGRAQTIQ